MSKIVATMLFCLALAGCGFGTDPATVQASAILAEDGYTQADQDRLRPELTRTISRLMTQFHCEPKEISAAAHKVRDAMKTVDPAAKVTNAVQILSRDTTKTLEQSTDTLVKSYSKSK